MMKKSTLMFFLCVCMNYSSHSIPPISHVADLDALMESGSSGTYESLLPSSDSSTAAATLRETLQKHLDTLVQKVRGLKKKANKSYVISTPEQEALHLLSKVGGRIDMSKVSITDPATFVAELFRHDQDLVIHIHHATPAQRVVIANEILKLYVDKTLALFSQPIPQKERQYMTPDRIIAQEQANIAQWHAARAHLEEILPSIVHHCQLTAHDCGAVKQAKSPFYTIVISTVPSSTTIAFTSRPIKISLTPSVATAAKSTALPPIVPDDL